ncbi:hypothetical protein J437_LFUL017496, partial [Ladona fulva]
SKAAEASHNICAVYGVGAIAERTARDWYAKFKKGNFDLKDAPCYGRPVEFDEERLNQLLHKNPWDHPVKHRKPNQKLSIAARASTNPNVPSLFVLLHKSNPNELLAPLDWLALSHSRRPWQRGGQVSERAKGVPKGIRGSRRISWRDRELNFQQHSPPPFLFCDPPRTDPNNLLGIGDSISG